MQDKSSIFPNIKNFYNTYIDRWTSLILINLLSVLKLEIKEFSKVFVIINTLDKYLKNNRRKANLLKYTSIFTFKLLVTMQPLNTIKSNFEEIISLDIYTDDKNIQIYMKYHISYKKKLV